ncbi:protein of unknown function [Legionella longbeachae NSW150]|uniref:Uncharacterized protein n=1 Tax=Legionella longbeachae serogroup 1 (strain NSW150) TaxID=661367 RepID=D3HMH5_LEGLN|nr:hypothetical protein LLB_2146 [Legionella longbeachae D-4968]CBJ13664.1 protein of unknown function [Legionella longbeachae NSW150]
MDTSIPTNFKCFAAPEIAPHRRILTVFSTKLSRLSLHDYDFTNVTVEKKQFNRYHKK